MSTSARNRCSGASRTVMPSLCRPAALSPSPSANNRIDSGATRWRKRIAGAIKSPSLFPPEIADDQMPRYAKHQTITRSLIALFHRCLSSPSFAAFALCSSSFLLSRPSPFYVAFFLPFFPTDDDSSEYRELKGTEGKGWLDGTPRRPAVIKHGGESVRARNWNEPSENGSLTKRVRSLSYVGARVIRNVNDAAEMERQTVNNCRAWPPLPLMDYEFRIPWLFRWSIARVLGTGTIRTLIMFYDGVEDKFQHFDSFCFKQKFSNIYPINLWLLQLATARSWFGKINIRWNKSWLRNDVAGFWVLRTFTIVSMSRGYLSFGLKSFLFFRVFKLVSQC